MAHIHNQEGGVDITASAVIIRTDGPKPRVTLHKHRKLNSWLHFGGHVENNEHAWQTVAREVAEESGYQLEQLSIVQPQHRLKNIRGETVWLHPTPLIFDAHEIPNDNIHYHCDLVFVLVTDEEPRDQPLEGESQEIRVFSKTEIENSSDIYPSIKDIMLFALDTVGNLKQSHCELLPANSYASF